MPNKWQNGGSMSEEMGSIPEVVNKYDQEKERFEKLPSYDQFELRTRGKEKEEIKTQIEKRITEFCNHAYFESEVLEEIKKLMKLAETKNIELDRKLIGTTIFLQRSNFTQKSYAFITDNNLEIDFSDPKAKKRLDDFISFNYTFGINPTDPSTLMFMKIAQEYGQDVTHAITLGKERNIKRQKRIEEFNEKNK